MTEFSDKEKAQISAETAKINEVDKSPIETIIERVDKWNGAGLRASEVLALRQYIHKLEYRITIELGYPIDK